MPSFSSVDLTDLLSKEAFFLLDVPGDGFCGLHASMILSVLFEKASESDSSLMTWLHETLALTDNAQILARCAKIVSQDSMVASECLDQGAVDPKVIAIARKDLQNSIDNLTQGRRQHFMHSWRENYEHDVAGLSFDDAVGRLYSLLTQKQVLGSSDLGAVYYLELFRSFGVALSLDFSLYEAPVRAEHQALNTVLGANAIPYQSNFVDLFHFFQRNRFSSDAPRTLWLSQEDITIMQNIMGLSKLSHSFKTFVFNPTNTHWSVSMSPLFCSGLLPFQDVDPGDYRVMDSGSAMKIKFLDSVVRVDLAAVGFSRELSHDNRLFHDEDSSEDMSVDESTTLLPAKGAEDVHAFFTRFCADLVHNATMHSRGGSWKHWSLWEAPSRQRVLRVALARLDSEIASLRNISVKVNAAKSAEIIDWITELTEIRRPALQKMYNNVHGRHSKRNFLIRLLQFLRDKLLYLIMFANTRENRAVAGIDKLPALQSSLRVR